ncbi:MAG: hypothetical protein HGA95_02615, partial [Caldiserica bacterium]|nr:hypothetical protein [Caldisericota bacterium]
KLENFNVADNQLTSLPKEIGNLKSLKGLILGQNQLTALPEEIGNFSSLEVLHLSYNQFMNDEKSEY